MNNIRIYYFSGTGMTKFFVDKLCLYFNEINVEVSLESIENVNTQDINHDDFDCIGISYPVHAFNAPKIVVDFVNRLPTANGVKAFIAYTAGDDSPLNRAASSSIIKILISKGYRVVYNKQLQMPSNFMARNTDAEVETILQNTEETAQKIAYNIYNNVSDMESPTSLTRILAKLGKLEWSGARFAGRRFYANSDCILCEKCINTCPNKNIRIVDNKIEFDKSCGLCMRCIYSCPTDAINIKKPFGFFKIKPWYKL